MNAVAAMFFDGRSSRPHSVAWGLIYLGLLKMLVGGHSGQCHAELNRLVEVISGVS